MTSKDLQELKYGRLSAPYKIVLDSFKGLKEYTYIDKPEWIFYKSDLGVFYAYNEKNNWLYYDYDLLYVKIQSYFDGNYQKICNFIQVLVEKHLKLKVVTTTFCGRSDIAWWKNISN